MKLKFCVITTVFIVICSVASPILSVPQTIIEDTLLYNQAGEHCKNGDFFAALSLYEKIIENGIRNPDVFYNASNAAYRAGFLGKAILYLERAKKLAPSDKDIRANLIFLDTVKQDQDQQSGNSVVTFIANYYDAVNTNSAALWSALSFALMMLFCIAALFTSGGIRYGIIAAVIFMVMICLFSTGIFVHKVHRSTTVAEAIIMVEEANSYSGPGEDNTHIFSIHEGTKVVIERSQDSWNLIRLKSGAGGWIQAEAMEKI